MSPRPRPTLLGAKPCPHGSEYFIDCEICTPPLENNVGAKCDELMASLLWRALKFSQPFRAAQTPGIPDRRYYPPADCVSGAWKPFWLELKRPRGWTTNKKQQEAQAAFRQMVEASGEHYVRGGLAELAQYLRDQGIKEVGIIG